MVTISWAITACNEHIELKRLLEQIESIKHDNDEIVLQLDVKYTSEVEKIAKSYNPIITALKGDFANFKNILKKHCTKDYIVFLDADELLSDDLAANIHEILDLNPEVECFALPRINIVERIETRPDLIRQWGWNISKLDDYITEKILDLSKSEDIITYNYLKDSGLIIEEKNC
jgi:glycosyltransferase involved in cell wall biosynthesis